MDLLACYVSFFITESLIKVGGLPISAEPNGGGEVRESLFQEILNELDPNRKPRDKKKVKVPQYMLDLFASVTDNKTGRRRPDIRLPGNIVRSFYSQALPLNENLPSRIVFNITDIPNTEAIRKCELHIYRRKSRHLSKDHRKKPHFHMIKVNLVGTRESIDDKLLSSKGFGWVRFDVTSAIKHASLPKPGVRDTLLKLSVAQVQQKQETFKLKFVFNKNDTKEPILVVYSDHTRSLQTTAIEHRKPAAKVPSHIRGADTKKRVKRNENCHREDMTVDTEKLGWKKTILEPKKFNAYRCSGSCSESPSNNKTNHAVIQAYVSQLKHGDSVVDMPCCSPLELKPKYFLIIQQRTPEVIVKLEELSKITVTSCGCL